MSLDYTGATATVMARFAPRGLSGAVLLAAGIAHLTTAQLVEAQDTASATCTQMRELTDAQRSLWLSPSTTLQLVRAPGGGMDEPTGYLTPM